MYQTGNKIKVTVFGQSHSEAIGAVIDGLPAGFRPDMDKIYEFMQRRAPGRDRFSTARREQDMPEIISGLVDGVTCGAPMCAVIKNHDQKSRDYDNLKLVPRPGHADFAAYMKYDTNNDIRGGGQFSGRMTAPLCFAGAICMQILAEKGVYIGAHIESVHGVCDKRFDPVDISKDQLFSVSQKDFCVIDEEAGERMKEQIDKAKKNLDSVGGCIECAIIGMPKGIGGPLFEGIEGRISQNIFAVPAIKGIEFGAGFSASNMYGSENNDSFCAEDGEIRTKTNNHGGILGGISSGMPIIFRVCVKPTPSIAKEQESVNLKTKKPEKLIVTGRHDPCILGRAVPVIEAVAAITMLDMLME